ncbi:hypothetical protein GGR56DRAFT_675742 [Xylariaceae sp. FL0804]|nr:hypothetical protein GGR56DRAFT_675742 [Xylariaceae sp. FL0804]
MDSPSSYSSSISDARPRGILKKSSSVDLYSNSRQRSSSDASKKSAAFDDVARDIVTGDEVPQSPRPGAIFRSRHRWYRQEAGRALLMTRIDGMFDDVVRRIDVGA